MRSEEGLVFGIDHHRLCDGKCPTCIFLELHDPVKKETVLKLAASFYESEVPTPKDELGWDTPIKEIGLTKSTLHLLDGCGYQTVRDIMNETVYEFRERTPRFGRIKHNDLVLTLAKKGFVPKSFSFWHAKPQGRRIRDCF